MDLSDEDPFALSDDEPMQEDIVPNPIQEHLLNKRHDVIDRVEKAKSNVAKMKELSDRILKKLQKKAAYDESSDSDSESHLYQVTGEPVIKKRCLRSSSSSQPLIVEHVWQKVVDTKWIAGIVLENTTNRTLKDPRLYVFVKEEREIRGITSFWRIFDESLWTKTDELDSESEKLVATIVMDLPCFENDNFVEAFGTISYLYDGKELQTAIPNFRLSAIEAIDRSFSPRFIADNAENSILAIKAVSVERTLAISLEGDAGRGARLLDFLEGRGFKEIVSDVWISKNQESFRHYIVEILPFTESEAAIQISARSRCHLNVIVHLLSEEFPDIRGSDSDERLMEAAIALEKELQLELAGDDAAAIHMARIRTDLLIP